MSCGVPCSCRSRSWRKAPSSTISRVHASCTCMGYAYWVKWAWNTSTTPGTRGRQADTSCRGTMQETYKTVACGGRQPRPMSNRFEVRLRAGRLQHPPSRHVRREVPGEGRAVRLCAIQWCQRQAN